MGVPTNGWLSMENPTKMDDMEVSPLQETSICMYIPNDTI